MSTILNTPRPEYMNEELDLLRAAVEAFIRQECLPYTDAWRKQGEVDRSVWRKAGQAGLLMASAPVEYGGAGGSFAHEAIIIDALGRLGAHEFLIAVQNVMFGPYLLRFGSEEQKQTYVPKLASGEWLSAIAMTEPGSGSDLAAMRTTAVRDGDHYVINGQKIFITLGSVADLFMVAAKTDPTAGSKGISLFLVEASSTPGFHRGKKLQKMGLNAHATSEIYFEDMRIPKENLLGGAEGQGFKQLMANLTTERVTIGIEAISMIERVLEETVAYTRDRQAFRQSVLDFQNTQFVLAECKTEATIGRVFIDSCISEHVKGQLDSVNAAMAKLWLSELQGKIIDRCLQLFGGYGYMDEYPISQLYRDARVSRIYGGSSEVMKLIIGRSL